MLTPRACPGSVAAAVCVTTASFRQRCVQLNARAQVKIATSFIRKHFFRFQLVGTLKLIYLPSCLVLLSLFPSLSSASTSQKQNQKKNLLYTLSIVQSAEKVSFSLCCCPLCTHPTNIVHPLASDPRRPSVSPTVTLATQFSVHILSFFRLLRFFRYASRAAIRRGRVFSVSDPR